MRKIINISVPANMKRFVELRVEQGEFGSVSEYFRDLIRADQRHRISVARSYHPTALPQTKASRGGNWQPTGLVVKHLCVWFVDFDI